VQKNISDPVTDYAMDVVNEKIIAGPHVRNACQRHLDDLEKASDRGFYFDVERALHVIGFFQEVLRLNGGEFEGEVYDPLPWQKFIIGSLFGWVNEDGYRRFRVSFVETGKGSGKSPLSAGIGMYGLTSDGEPRAEVYAAAAKKDQAMVLFRDAVAMVDMSPDLSGAIVKSGTGQNVWNLAFLEQGSFFRPISADDGQSGPRPHISLLDEIHEHKNSNVVDMLRAGTKGRRQALMFMITNSGHDKTSVCWNYHEYGKKVAAGQIQDDSFFSYICALDENDDPMNDETCWPKANPSLGVTIKPDYLRELVTQAKGMPSAESIVRRLNFCEWVGAESPWISSDVWLDAQESIEIDQLRGRSCWGGLDLSSTQDLTALALIFEPTEDDPVYRLVPYFWLPEEGLSNKAEKDGVDYLMWKRDGYLETTPGKAISKLAVCKRIIYLSSLFDIMVIGYDRWRIEDLKQILADEGEDIPLDSYGQGYKDMAPAVDEFERLLLSDEIKHNGNPAMTWCAANATTEEDPAGNRKISKKKATGRVDGIVATLNAIGMLLKREKEEPHAYNDRGFITL
jgi:phage terminase large subunit-like protein